MTEHEEKIGSLEHKIRILKLCIADDTDNEEAARKQARRVLTDLETYGDSYGVPTIADIVEKLVDMIQVEHLRKFAEKVNEKS